MTGRARGDTLQARLRATLMPTRSRRPASATSPPMSISTPSARRRARRVSRVFGPVTQGAWLDAMGLAAARRRARQGRARARRRDHGRPRPADRARPDGAAVQGAWRWSRPAGPSRRGSDDDARYLARRDGRRRAAARRGSGRQSFIETFGHLYTPENLAAFLDQSQRGELARRARPIRATRCGSASSTASAAGFCQARPALPAVRRSTGPSVELRQFYVLKPWQGAGLAPQMMDWVIAEARRRGAEEIFLSVFVDNLRAQRFYARYGFEAGRRATTSWSAPMPTRTSSCGWRCERHLSRRGHRPTARRSPRWAGAASSRPSARISRPTTWRSIWTRMFGAGRPPRRARRPRAARADGRGGRRDRRLSQARADEPAGAARAGRARDQAALRARRPGRARASRRR